MSGKKQLPPVRVVDPDEQVPPVSRLDRLRAMREVLEAHIHSEKTLARDLSPLVRQAREVGKEIDDLEKDDAAREEAEVSVDDSRFAGDAEFRLEAI